VNLVAGAGDVGASLVSDERIDGVAFTGSVATGKKVAAACAQRVARMNLEMGGKDPFIVCADVAADVSVAARGGAWAAYLNAGQVCTPNVLCTGSHASCAVAEQVPRLRPPSPSGTSHS
jgi:acyl-CoA reductase-like NAD-dependent aldehyde dehydrogenase